MGSGKKISTKKNAPLLNPKWEKFCQLYVSNDRELFGNGTQCYISAFMVDLAKKGAYLRTRVKASQLLTKGNITNRINELLETGGFNDENVQKQHLFLLNQHADLKTKIKAVGEYYKLKGKYAPEEKNVTVKGLKVFMPEEVIGDE